VKYACISENRDQFEATMMCRLLEVPRSSFYAWLTRPASNQAKKAALISEAIRFNFAKFKKRYGAYRLTLELNETDIPCSLNYVAKLMKDNGLRARNGKGFRYMPATEAMTNVANNLLKRNFSANAPNEKWVSDITYIRVGNEWLYLAVIMDLYSRKVIGWALADHMRESLIIEAFNMASSLRKIEPEAVIHSDRGVQYRGNKYQQLLEDNKIECSMSRKGNCWDNAAMESFFSRLKVELIYPEKYQTEKEAYTGIFEYIELFYNPIRRHSTLGYMSPNDYEAKPNGT
jgi:transposase InsO family protein